MRNLRREINPWSARDSAIIGRLNRTGRMQDCLGMTSLHILSCSTRHALGMYELIVHKYPENLVTRDRWGDFPLLYALWFRLPLLIANNYQNLAITPSRDCYRSNRVV